VAADGSLQPVPGSPFPIRDWPSSLGFSPNGQFLYDAHFASGSADGQSVDANGALTPVPGTPFLTRQSQVGVLALTTFPAPGCPGKEGLVHTDSEPR
jgi:hypothetical protein